MHGLRNLRPCPSLGNGTRLPAEQRQDLGVLLHELAHAGATRVGDGPSLSAAAAVSFSLMELRMPRMFAKCLSISQ
jgi:hypothetical protein